MSKTTHAAKAAPEKTKAADANAAELGTDAAEETTLTIEEQLAALKAENEALKGLTQEQGELLAVHEKVGDHVIVTVDGRKARVNGSLRTEHGIKNSKEIAADKKLLAHLAKIGAHTLQFID